MSAREIHTSQRELISYYHQRSQKPNSLSEFNRKITELCKKNYWKDAPPIIEQIKNSGLKPDAFSYTPLINMFSNSRHIKKAIFYYDQMISEGVTPSLISFNITLKGIVDNRNQFKDIDDYIGKIADIMDDMITLRVQPDVKTFSTIINGFVEVGKIDAAVDYFNLMLKMDVIPNTHIFNILIKGFVRSDRFAEAFQYYHKMEEEFKIERDVFTYSSFIPQLVTANKFDEAFAISKRMLLEGIEHTTFTYTALIKAYIILGEMNEALGLFQDMKAKGVHSDKVIYTNIIQGLKSAGRSEEGNILFQEMIENGIRPDRISFRALNEPGYKF